VTFPSLRGFNSNHNPPPCRRHSYPFDVVPPQSFSAWAPFFRPCPLRLILSAHSSPAPLQSLFSGMADTPEVAGPMAYTSAAITTELSRSSLRHLILGFLQDPSLKSRLRIGHRVEDVFPRSDISSRYFAVIFPPIPPPTPPRYDRMLWMQFWPGEVLCAFAGVFFPPHSPLAPRTNNGMQFPDLTSSGLASF